MYLKKTKVKKLDSKNISKTSTSINSNKIDPELKKSSDLNSQLKTDLNSTDLNINLSLLDRKKINENDLTSIKERHEDVPIFQNSQLKLKKTLIDSSVSSSSNVSNSNLLSTDSAFKNIKNDIKLNDIKLNDIKLNDIKLNNKTGKTENDKTGNNTGNDIKEEKEEEINNFINIENKPSEKFEIEIVLDNDDEEILKKFNEINLNINLNQFDQMHF